MKDMKSKNSKGQMHGQPFSGHSGSGSKVSTGTRDGVHNDGDYNHLQPKDRAMGQSGTKRQSSM